MTDTFRIRLSRAQEAPTNWPGVKCFRLEDDFCGHLRHSLADAQPTTVYGVNGNGDLETRWRYRISEFRCVSHIDGEVQPEVKAA